MQQILFILFFFCSSAIIAQTDIKGRVLDQQGAAIIGANVFIEGSYDGSVTDENGDFQFKTSEAGVRTLVISRCVCFVWSYRQVKRKCHIT